MLTTKNKMVIKHDLNDQICESLGFASVDMGKEKSMVLLGSMFGGLFLPLFAIPSLYTVKTWFVVRMIQI